MKVSGLGTVLWTWKGTAYLLDSSADQVREMKDELRESEVSFISLVSVRWDNNVGHVAKEMIWSSARLIPLTGKITDCPY